MSSIAYTASRVRVPGHVQGATYVFDLQCQAVDPSGGPAKETQTSLSGRKQSLRFYRERFYDVTARPLSGGELLQLLEFLVSCESDETFVFDPYGTIGVPLSPVNATLEGNGNFDEQRFQPKGRGGADDFFVVRFRVRTVEA